MLTCTCFVAGEQVGAANENNMLDQIQPSRWSPKSKSCCTCVEMVLGKASDGSFFWMLVAERIKASIFNIFAFSSARLHGSRRYRDPCTSAAACFGTCLEWTEKMPFAPSVFVFECVSASINTVALW